MILSNEWSTLARPGFLLHYLIFATNTSFSMGINFMFLCHVIFIARVKSNAYVLNSIVGCRAGYCVVNSQIIEAVFFPSIEIVHRCIFYLIVYIFSFFYFYVKCFFYIDVQYIDENIDVR